MSRYKEHRGPVVAVTTRTTRLTMPESSGSRIISAQGRSLTPGSEPVEASVKWFNADKGFGFVIVAGGADAFLPARALEIAGHSSLPDGARLKVRISQGQKGPQVAEVLEVDTSTAQVMSKAGVLRLVPPRHGQERDRQRNVSVRSNGTTSKRGSVS